MATTNNHKITKTIKKAIDYAVGDKIEDIENAKDDIKDSIAYAINDKTGKIIYPTIYTTLNCGPGHPYETFNKIMKNYGMKELQEGNNHTKNGAPVQGWHWTQSFEGHVDPMIANEIGRKLAQEVFGDFPVVISTHTNTENIHNHFIVCAWNIYGQKWHNHNAAYRHIREVSDRLCDEYGLHVLEETRNQKLIKWKDEDGKTHYYEPTNRKNEMIRKREAGEISPDDVGSYRNTIAYEKTVNKEQTNKEIIRQDIDRLLPVVNSYEHLLEMLRNIGYTIKDKKKNGDWLTHVAFQPPTADKATRDYKISDDGFYIRENLERVIAEFVKDRGLQKAQVQELRKAEEQKEKNIPYFEEYVYGKTDLSTIDDDYRTVRQKDGTFTIKERGEAEKKIIRNVRKNDDELFRLIDTTELERLIKEQKGSGKKKGHISKRREEVLVQQIEESFYNLRFMEQENLYSQNQINSIVKSLWGQYNNCLTSLNKLEIVVSHLETVMKVPQKAEIIEARIERMKGNDDYRENEMDADFAQLKEYRNTMKKYKLDDPDSVKDMEVKVRQAKEKIEKLQGALSSYSVKLSDYDRCVATLNRIDREAGWNNGEMLKEYREISRKGEEEARQNEEKRNKRKAAER